MIRLGVCFALVAICTPPLAAAQSLKVHKLDQKALIEGLPLIEKEFGESGDGRLRHRWKISGPDMGSFEIIGNLQSDADLVAWQCREYDEAGNARSTLREESFCRKFFVSVLRNVSSRPEGLANDLLIEAERTKATALRQSGDISIDTDGQFYFLRRLSRQ